MTVQLGARDESTASGVRPDPQPVHDGRSVVGSDPALVLHHGDGAPSGQLLNALVTRGSEAVVVRVTGATELPDPTMVRVAIVVGSDRFQDAGTEGYLDGELDWARRADGAGTAIMGIGHGARMLAAALGGQVIPAARPIRGWVMVDTSLPHLVPTGPWLTWQHDIVRLPSHAQVLAHNRLGPQAFRLGRHLGVQFHPEATPRMVADWIRSDDDSLEPDQVLGVVSRDQRAAASCTTRLFSTFINSVPAPGRSQRTDQ
jgi:GMP synthase (glutamine-hydrolysing)